jgi:hypothetical protein
MFDCVWTWIESFHSTDQMWKRPGSDLIAAANIESLDRYCELPVFAR